MINVSMTSPEGVTLATKSKYCEDNIKIIPDFDFAKNTKRWALTIEADLSAKTLLFTDDWLAQHRADENLVVFFMKKETVGSERTHGVFISSYCCNTPILATEDITLYGQSFRKANNGNSYSISCSYDPMTSTRKGYGGQILIDTDGGLQIECSETYKIIAGEYEVIAWLM